MVTVGALLPICSTTAFWIQAKPLHLRNILNKSEQNAQSQKLQCLQPALVKRKVPVLHDKGQPHICTFVQKLNKFGYKLWPSLPYSPGLLPVDYHLLQASQQLFSGKMLPQGARGRRCFPRVHQIWNHRFSCYRNKQTYFSLANVHIYIRVYIYI